MERKRSLLVAVLGIVLGSCGGTTPAGPQPGPIATPTPAAQAPVITSFSASDCGGPSAGHPLPGDRCFVSCEVSESDVNPVTVSLTRLTADGCFSGASDGCAHATTRTPGGTSPQSVFFTAVFSSSVETVAVLQCEAVDSRGNHAVPQTVCVPFGFVQCPR
jgi:hypothetical protein